MALSFYPADLEAIGLDEYIDAVKGAVNVQDIDTVAATAPLLKRLGNNRTFVVEHLNEQLKLWPANALPFYSVQSSILASDGPVSVRMNIWPTIATDPRRRKVQSNVYSYFDTHDHNFTFMTVGYFGAGYGTRIYEYDASRVIGYPGEPVDIRFLEETTLPVGKVMLYRPGRDIHMQLPPDEFSMSLNLMVVDAHRESLRDQYYFDIERSCISGYVESNSSKRISQIEMMRFVGDDNSVDILWAVARRHPCARTRLAALETIVAIKPDEADGAWRFGAADPSELVRRACTRRADAQGEAPQ
jgi:hypothetical protein